MIGVFDSGVGGLTVVKEIKKAMPDCSIVYFGDTARYPWGNKNAETVQRYSEEICIFLIAQGVEDIVIACNTASTFAGDYLRKKFPKINFFNVIDPVVDRIKLELSAEKNQKRNIRAGVIGTRGTIESRVYEKKIKKNNPTVGIISQACPLFVSMVEENMTSHPAAKIIVDEYLKKIKKAKVDFLVLGCTHYPLLEKVIRKSIGNVAMISSAKEVAKELLRRKNIREDFKEKDIFYFSDVSNHYDKLTRKILGKKIKIIKKAL
ncbi:MAG: Glutamate racemase [Candidatus Moranbacteria bacterium GW2011_GWE2_35_2-]|nr:MAG: Glutamate racemase [Candidatus Moranbacteria bacterium GW2011_GWE2_35_2-]KKQ04371.1 MAG: Glutamate racemase [Candidatus Moranbacteria bacterium GW2011_GWF1_36_4]KKQ22541.1 MAG: Glutamate racemase [Candidatus Moranbacteria bacterium GW2011_GWF2_37_11]KKQ29610.1 MAG: Glutamate racemase [Candidatus Moranbacteria bacterium GW2011_GWD1_37_17]KKQ30519.1 MAG: Glutamate racemase [Candidatus Moranbacteria bacterium GW2011_GWE1_37_24]KKQ46638.1 MAG: Glutamate racemase [Candidatus Moranbacteria b